MGWLEKKRKKLRKNSNKRPRLKVNRCPPGRSYDRRAKRCTKKRRLLKKRR